MLQVDMDGDDLEDNALDMPLTDPCQLKQPCASLNVVSSSAIKRLGAVASHVPATISRTNSMARYRTSISSDSRGTSFC